MMIILLNFLVVLFFMAIFFFLATNEKKFSLKQKKLIIVTAVLLLAILAGVRQIGTDLQAYKYIFNTTLIIHDFGEYIKNMFSYKYEPGFMILISTMKQAGLGFEFFLFISALIPMLLLYNIIIKVEKKLPLTVFLFFLLMFAIRGPLDIIRHFFAATIYLSALYSLSKNKNTLYYIKSGTSFLFHYSNIVTVLIKPLLSINWRITKYILALVIMFIAGISFQGLVVNIIGQLNYESSVIFKLQNYLIDDYEYSSIAHFIIRNLMENSPAYFNIFIIILALYYKGAIYNNKFNGIILNSIIVGTLLYSFLFGIGAYTMAIRINFLFGIGSIFIVKEIFIKIIESKRSILFALIILYLLFYNFIIVVYYSGVFKYL
jgi:hypothetical protein